MDSIFFRFRSNFEGMIVRNVNSIVCKLESNNGAFYREVMAATPDYCNRIIG